MIIELLVAGSSLAGAAASYPVYKVMETFYKKRKVHDNSKAPKNADDLFNEEMRKIDEDYSRLYTPTAFWLHPKLWEHADSDLSKSGSISAWEADLPEIKTVVNTKKQVKKKPRTGKTKQNDSSEAGHVHQQHREHSHKYLHLYRRYKDGSIYKPSKIITYIKNLPCGCLSDGKITTLGYDKILQNERMVCHACHYSWIPASNSYFMRAKDFDKVNFIEECSFSPWQSFVLNYSKR